ncbi:threonine--tRNA ligase [Feifania hominis]|uniref:Threonine--tRNA ligase n=1 Tax=Feifania hominis TaxID=2763660 RepID=A0A926HQQ0_9FIRM|nr:threonine--tRNA ligase [Feifania hominis]MBC8536582.1 threonine--tRNA ligase [Feifania hominis]
MINITLKDGSVKAFESGVTPLAIAESLSAGLARNVLAAELDGKVCDLLTPIDHDAKLALLTFDDEGGKKTFWHTASHVLAQAVKRLYPAVKLTIGPAIDNGFYYDFDTETPFTPEDLEKLEKEMKKIVDAKLPVRRFELPRDEAIALMKEKDEPYKVTLIEELPPEEHISFYEQGEFTDLCAGPHLPDTGKIKAFKLIQSTGAYWRGDAKNKMLQRVYGIAFPKAKELDEYLARLEEAKRRDHRKLGRELDLFDIYEEGPGFPFFLPKGMVLRNLLEDFWREEHRKHGYQEIRTPMILSEELWHRSGHWDHYKENMYFTKIDDADFAIKPMNCPGGMLVYKRRLHSYRDLPQRMAELGLVHRHELSGALHGLMRVRCFTQDDAHIFMTPEQIEQEIVGVIDLIDGFYKVFGFKYHVELSTRPEDSMGSDEQWEIATNALRRAMEDKGMDFVVNEGDGAFYGPKIDFHLEDSIGRTWQCGTIQLDFQMPERFDLTYVGADGEKHRPVMIHRVVFGSIERFIAILTEHFAGAYPLWLAPVQVKVIPLTDRQLEASQKIAGDLAAAGLRVEVDERSEKMGFKIREAQLQKIPYMLVIGDKELEKGVVSVRSRSDGDLGTMTADAFLAKTAEEIRTKAL